MQASSKPEIPFCTQSNPPILPIGHHHVPQTPKTQCAPTEPIAFLPTLCDQTSPIVPPWPSSPTVAAHTTATLPPFCLLLTPCSVLSIPFIYMAHSQMGHLLLLLELQQCFFLLGVFLVFCPEAVNMLSRTQICWCHFPDTSFLEIFMGREVARLRQSSCIPQSHHNFCLYF